MNYQGAVIKTSFNCVYLDSHEFPCLPQPERWFAGAPLVQVILGQPDWPSEVNRRAMRDVNRLENRLAEGRVRMNGSGNFVVG